MNREQIIQDIVAKLQQLPEAQLQEASELIADLFKEGNQNLTSEPEPKPYPLPADDENRNRLEEAPEIYKTGIYSRLQALSETLKTTSDQLLLKTVQRFLHIIEMKQFRSNLKGKAQQQGFNSEDDILSSFS